MQNAGDLAFKIQKLSIIPEDHIDVNWTSFDKKVFEVELKYVKDVARILDNAKNYDRKRCQSLELFDKIYKDHVDDLLTRLQKLKKTAAEFNHFNGACDTTHISELINQLAGEK